MKNYQIGKHWTNAKQLESSNFPQLPTPSAAPFYLFFSWKRGFGWWTCSRIPIGAALPVGDLGQLSILDQTILGVLGQYLVSTRVSASLFRKFWSLDLLRTVAARPSPSKGKPLDQAWAPQVVRMSSKSLAAQVTMDHPRLLWWLKHRLHRYYMFVIWCYYTVSR